MDVAAWDSTFVYFARRAVECLSMSQSHGSFPGGEIVISFEPMRCLGGRAPRAVIVVAAQAPKGVAAKNLKVSSRLRSQNGNF